MSEYISFYTSDEDVVTGSQTYELQTANTANAGSGANVIATNSAKMRATFNKI